MRKLFTLVLFLAAAVSALPAENIQLCGLVEGTGALAAHAVDTPLTILGDVIRDSSWKLEDFQLVPTQDIQVRHNAMAQHCTTPFCNCIFYDPAFLPIAPSSSPDSWLAYYVLAHEAGHIIKANIGSTRIEKEAAADEWAGWALEKIHAPIEFIIAGVDYVATSEDVTGEYHSRCERRHDAVKGYNHAAELVGRPQYTLCDDCAASSQGLYLTTDLSKGAPIRSGAVVGCGYRKKGDLPIDFDRDLRGACLVADKKAGTQLTWDLVGICQP